jgi:hypothetical protein
MHANVSFACIYTGAMMMMMTMMIMIMIMIIMNVFN